MQQVLINQNNLQTEPQNQTEIFNAQKEIVALKEKVTALEVRLEKASNLFGGRI